MPDQPTLRVNSPPVSHELIDGEIMVIHFETGSYYNLRGSAVTVWEQVARRGTREDIVAAVSRAWRGDPAEIRRAVSEFLDRLVLEDLIVAADGPAPQPGSAAASASAAEPPSFLPPQLDKFTDMGDFLLADPVHDTDEAGWPTPQAKPTDPS